jgi:hypothetical protein
VQSPPTFTFVDVAEASSKVQLLPPDTKLQPVKRYEEFGVAVIVHVPPLSTTLLVGLTDPPVPAVTVSVLVCLKLALIVQSPLTVIDVLFEFLSAIEHLSLPDEKVQFTNLYELSGVAEMLTLEPTSTVFEPEGEIEPPEFLLMVNTAVFTKVPLIVQDPFILAPVWALLELAIAQFELPEVIVHLSKR